MLAAPSRQPRTVPTSRTAAVWPVYGTSVQGILKASWAEIAVRPAPASTRVTARRTVPTRSSPAWGTRTSASVLGDSGAGRVVVELVMAVHRIHWPAIL